MSVSSDASEYTLEVVDSRRDDYDELHSVWSLPKAGLSHSRSPACLVGAEDHRDIRIWKLYNSDNQLVAYFPFEEKTRWGIRIIHAAFHELTLDFIDIEAIPEYQSIACDIFWKWVKDQKNVVVDIVMCDEESQFVRSLEDHEEVIVTNRGFYHYNELPDTFEEHLSNLGRSTRQRTKKYMKANENTYRLEALRGKILGDELETLLNDLKRLHLYVFPENSLMIPHWDNLARYITTLFADDAGVFFRVRDLSTGEVIATDLYVHTNNIIGMYQGGRRVEEQYSNIASWMRAKIIEWAIAEKIDRCEFLFGDQEWKQRESNKSRPGVSLTYFSSPRARYTYRLLQRLG